MGAAAVRYGVGRTLLTGMVMTRHGVTGVEVAAGEERAGAHPAEREFYYLNFLSIFGARLAPYQIDEIATAAACNRAAEKTSFERRLSAISDSLPQNASEKPRRLVCPIQPLLRGWTPDAVQLIHAERTQGNGLLVALFHFGAHRHLLLDLAALGVPLSAPIAGRAYWDYYNLKSKTPKSFSECLKLMEVESRSAGRQLLLDIRRGRVGALYVDGNMGPDGHHVTEGATSVTFFTRQVRVKAGIARLAMSTGASILPVFATTTNGAGDAQVAIGKIIPPPRSSSISRQGAVQQLMQALYGDLERQVATSPAAWEYALCLHRWIISKQEVEGYTPMHASSDSCSHGVGVVKINSERVATIDKGGDLFLIDVETQLGYKIPHWYREYLLIMRSGKGLGCELFRNDSQGQSHKLAMDITRELIRKGLAVLE